LNKNNALMAPAKIPKVSQLNPDVISVRGKLKASDIGPEIIPMGASIPDITK